MLPCCSLVLTDFHVVRVLWEGTLSRSWAKLSAYVVKKTLTGTRRFNIGSCRHMIVPDSGLFLKADDAVNVSLTRRGGHVACG